MLVFQNIIMPILLALFAGCNVLQLVNNRQLRKKLAAEAQQAENDTWGQIISGQTQEIARLQTAYGDLQTKYFTLAEELQALKAQMAGKKSATKKS